MLFYYQNYLVTLLTYVQWVISQQKDTRLDKTIYYPKIKAHVKSRKILMAIKSIKSNSRLLKTMGALTLKNFPFELRGWDIEKLDSIDPTSSFGLNTKVYVNKNKIIQIEPGLNLNNSSSWLTDKGRQFFDSTLRENLEYYEMPDAVDSLLQVLYIFNHCKTQQKLNRFFIIIFENLSLEILSLLSLIEQKYAFIKIRRLDKFSLNNNLESNFQLNKTKLKNSTLCLLVYNNPRYEGYYLNLSLRQRFLKGNFKCLVIGSIIDLTFPVFFLGSTLKTLKTIIEGNNLICQEIKQASNPIFFFNTEFSKRNIGKKILEFQNLNFLSKFWVGTNLLEPSLNETGNQLADKFLPVNVKDFDGCSSVYFLNLSTNNIKYLRTIIKLKLLDLNFHNNFIVIEHNCEIFRENSIALTAFGDYPINEYFVPCSMFYENSETFVNTEGFVKRSTKLIFENKNQNSWQILRRLLKNLDDNATDLQNKNFLIFAPKNLTHFKIYSHFNYQATKTLTNLNFYLNLKNESFTLTNKTLKFKPTAIKMNLTKQKYWLDDFYVGGKDEYSYNSLTLFTCSSNLREQLTNFF